MRVSMGIATLLNLAALIGLAGLPGWLLYRAWLKSLGLSWRVSVGLVLAALSVLFTGFSSLFGYSLALTLASGVGFLALAGAAFLLTGYLRRRAFREQRSFTSLSVATPPSASPHSDVSPGATEGRMSASQGSDKDSVFRGALPELLFHLLLFGVFVAPAFVLYLPLDTDAQGFGYLALMIREGGTINTLTPWQPDVEYLYSPALFIWWAFFSDLLALPLHQVMLPFTHIMAGLAALLTVDLGQALLPGRRHLRWLMPLTFTVGLGFFLTLMDSAYTSIMALLFVILFLTLAFSAVQTRSAWLTGFAPVALAAVALTHPDTIIILLLGYVPFYGAFWLSQSQHRTRETWLRLFVLIPVIGVALTVPWLARVWPLFFEEHVVSPFPLSRSHVTQLVLYQGGLIPLLALGGAAIALRRRWLADVLMLTWLVFVVDFSIFGLTASLAAPVGLDLMRYVYPFSVAWHGPIIPYAYLAALAGDYLLDRWPVKPSPRFISGLLGAGVALIGLAVTFQRPFLDLSRRVLNIYGAFSSRADLAAMAYLRENTPQDALILNYPFGFEGHWVPVIAERESVAFREQPFFSGAEPYYERAARLAGVYLDPAGEETRALVEEYGVTHIIIPQIVAAPDRFGDMQAMMRWRWPRQTWYPLASSPSDADWLELVFEQDGAQVYRVLPAERDD
ncbi:MAG TPA: hypothetical protein ENI95_02685 [Chloroflexi bacterium]|nr:hypothetical protein [Chloroflexota bacterium]